MLVGTDRVELAPERRVHQIRISSASNRGHAGQHEQEEARSVRRVEARHAEMDDGCGHADQPVGRTQFAVLKTILLTTWAKPEADQREVHALARIAISPPTRPTSVPLISTSASASGRKAPGA